MYKNILVPIDGSPTSKKALDEAVELARLTGGRIHLLHVVDLYVAATGFEAAGAYMNDLRPVLVGSGEELVAKAKADVEQSGIAVETEVYESVSQRVSEIIVQRAESLGADLIVLGTHGRRGIERIVMGSDAEQVVRTAPVPVLLVRQSS